MAQATDLPGALEAFAEALVPGVLSTNNAQAQAVRTAINRIVASVTPTDPPPATPATSTPPVIPPGFFEPGGAKPPNT